MEDLVFIGYTNNIIKHTEKAVLFDIGTSNSGHRIERFVPKSQMYQRGDGVYVPKWLARRMGLWNHNSDNEYRIAGYTRMYDDADDDLPF